MEYTAAFIPSVPKPISFGSASIVPTKLDMPLSKASVLKLMILPIASSLLFMGVASKVAMVPLSFSPAIDSGAIPIHPLNMKTISSMGSIIEKTSPVTSLSEARL